MQIDQPALYASLVRIRDTRGTPVGVGFLLAEGVICTCAHVVAKAIGLENTPRTAPRDAVYIDFPYLDAQLRPTTVRAWGVADQDRDIALLELPDRPQGSHPAPLLSAAPSGRRPIKAVGFPAGYAIGLWAEGVVQERAVNGWVQLAANERDLLVRPGFSGGPVWDINGEGVIGVIVATPTEHAGAPNIAWFIPIEDILAVSGLHAQVRRPSDARDIHVFTEALIERGGYTPVQSLSLSTETAQAASAFDIVGIRWSSFYAFTVALVRADGLTANAIVALCEQFAAFNNGLYRHPQGLGVPWPIWLVGFTLAGTLCLVFERGGAAEQLALLDEQQRAAPAYAKGLDSMFWVQTTATSLVWALDVPARKLYRNFGKQPDGSNYHARWTVQELDRLEVLLREQLGTHG